MPELWPWLIAMLLAYLVGSIPFGLIIGLSRGVDIREKGSGNIGATNLGRAIGRKWGVICFLLDLLKGAVPILIYGAYSGVLGGLETFRGLAPRPEDQPTSMQLAAWVCIAAAAVLGHVFPLYLRFKGGKGVATAFGAILAMWPELTVPAVAAFFVWFVVLKAFRFVGLASCAAAVSLPVWYILWRIPKAPESLDHVFREVGRGWSIILVTLLLAGLVIYRHRGNLRRILQGTEPRVGE